MEAPAPNPEDMILIDQIGDAAGWGDAAEVAAAAAAAAFAIDDDDSDSQEEDRPRPHPLRRDNHQVAMLLDAPLEPPPMGVFQARRAVQHPQPTRSKRRSSFTIVRPSLLGGQGPERSSLLLNASQAIRNVQAEQRSEYFAEYLFEHMTSQNYPNGAGLPHHWGQF